MSARKLFVEHHFNGRKIKAWSLDQGHSRYIIGAGRGSDIRLHGHGVGALHSLILYEQGAWKVIDLGTEQGSKWNGSSLVEAPVVENGVLKIGEHELHLKPAPIVRKLYSASNLSAVGAQQEILIYYHNQIVDVVYTDGNKNYLFEFNGQSYELPQATKNDWDEKTFGELKIRWRLVDICEPVRSDQSVKINKDLSKSAGLVFSLFGIFLLISALLSYFKNEEAPIDTRMTRMIYDAKIMKTKKAKSVEKRSHMAGSNKNIERSLQKGVGSTRAGKATVSTRVISDIKASGLSQLIGKIAVRAGKNSVAFGASGRAETNENAHGVVTGSLIKGTFDAKAGVGEGYKIAGVGTEGKSGGSQGYKAGAGLGGAGVGTGEVGLLEEESVVEGGLDREVIAAVIKESLGEIRYCYERHLSSNPDLSGKVQVKFTIGSKGSVVDQGIGASTLSSANVEGCILRRVARWKFPNPKGGTSVIVTYPFLFKSLN